MENKLDGTAAAGILQEIFPFEMTLVQGTYGLRHHQCYWGDSPPICMAWG